VGGGLVLREADPAQGPVHGVFGNWPRGSADAWKDQPADKMPRNRMQLFEDCNGLRRQWNAVGPTHLHAFGRNAPYRAIQIKFGPCRTAQLARPARQHGQQLQRGLCCGLALETINGPQQATERQRFRDSRPRLHLGRYNGAFQCLRRVVRRPCRHDRKPEHRTYDRPQSPCRFQLAFGFERLKHAQDFPGGNRANRKRSKGRLGHAKQPFDLAGGDGRHTVPLLPGEQFVGHGPERVGERFGLRGLRTPSVSGRVDTLPQQRLGLIAPGSRRFKRYTRRRRSVGTDGQFLLSPSKAVSEIPKFAAGGRDPELQPTAVSQLRKPFAWPSLPNRNIGEHVRFPKSVGLKANKKANNFRDCQRTGTNVHTRQACKKTLFQSLGSTNRTVENEGEH